MRHCGVCGKFFSESNSAFCSYQCACVFADRVIARFDESMQIALANIFPEHTDETFLKACGIAPL